MPAAALTVVPGHSLGQLHLGASLYEILTLVKGDKATYPSINVHHSQSEPLATPVVVGLPENGLRLRFDGADQRLRLIEVLDFRKAKLQHKGSDLIKSLDDSNSSSGPGFKRVYSLFGPSYPGEYIAPRDSSPRGTYVLSWAGIAFNFPLLHSAWSPEKDHVSLLGSNLASPATQMALFEGKSWAEARRDLFVRQSTGPRMSALSTRSKDSLPAEIEHANVLGDRKIELFRLNAAGNFTIVLNQTTPQDLLTELGPPDVTHRREERDATPEQTMHKRTSSTSRPRSNGRHPGSQPSSYSSTGTDTFETEFESGEMDEDSFDRSSRQKFWCYFNHGLDILVGPPIDRAPLQTEPTPRTPLTSSPHLVVLKVVVHGNVPGSYAFNRHRRLRWYISLPGTDASGDYLSSEHHFDQEIKPILMAQYAGVWPEAEMGRGKVINRTWGGEDSSDSGFFLPDAGQDLEDGGGSSEQWLGNTKLYSFPGLAFEVLDNGAVSALTVSSG